jgi:hypothetical protein
MFVDFISAQFQTPRSRDQEVCDYCNGYSTSDREVWSTEAKAEPSKSSFLCNSQLNLCEHHTIHFHT